MNPSNQLKKGKWLENIFQGWFKRAYFAHQQTINQQARQVLVQLYMDQCQVRTYCSSAESLTVGQLDSSQHQVHTHSGQGQGEKHFGQMSLLALALGDMESVIHRSSQISNM